MQGAQLGPHVIAQHEARTCSSLGRTRRRGKVNQRRAMHSGASMRAYPREGHAGGYLCARIGGGRAESRLQASDAGCYVASATNGHPERITQHSWATRSDRPLLATILTDGTYQLDYEEVVVALCGCPGVTVFPLYFSLRIFYKQPQRIRPIWDALQCDFCMVAKMSGVDVNWGEEPHGLAASLDP